MEALLGRRMTGDSELDTDQFYVLNDYATGGRLSSTGRMAAIGSALSVVGRYFQSGSARSVDSSALATVEGASELDLILSSSLRFRGTLSVAGQVIQIVESIQRRPTFRYALVDSESIGQVTGALDVGRYVSTRATSFGSAPTFPITDVRRNSDTPENVLAVYSCLWIIEELVESALLAQVPKAAPEAMRSVELQDRLRALLNRPSFQSLKEMSAEVLRRKNPTVLFERVRERLRRHEIADGTGYGDLLRYVEQLHLYGPAGLDGLEPWSFYDDSFDPRLFELWCLHQLGICVSKALSVSEPTFESSATGLAYKWERPAGTIEIYFQRSLTSVISGASSYWRRVDGGSIQGKPDFVVKVTARETGNVRFAIVDAKLRQRSGVPTEELYKILGYFQNFGIFNDQKGVIISYDPALRESRFYEYYSGETNGHMIATVLNPADVRQSESGLFPVASMILGLLDIPVRAQMNVGEDDEVEAGRVVDARLQELAAISVTIAPQTLEASERRLKALLGESRWNGVDDAGRVMMATAEHVGFFLSEEADYSGPILGLISPIERLLDQRLVQLVRDKLPSERRLKRLTLGALLNYIEQALTSGSDVLALEFKGAIGELGLDHAEFLSITHDLQQLNRSYRAPAAHKESMSRKDWQGAYDEILVGHRILQRSLDSFVLTRG